MANTKIVLNRQSDLILDNAQITNPQGIVLTDISGVSEAVASINTATSTEISTEASARVDGDASLQNQIDFITNNTDPAAIDSLVEVVVAFQSADGDLNGAITNLANAATVDLSAEVSRATSVEAQLSDANSSLNLEFRDTVGQDNKGSETNTKWNQYLDYINGSITYNKPDGSGQLDSSSFNNMFGPSNLFNFTEFLAYHERLSSQQERQTLFEDYRETVGQDNKGSETNTKWNQYVDYINGSTTYNKPDGSGQLDSSSFQNMFGPANLFNFTEFLAYHERLLSQQERQSLNDDLQSQIDFITNNTDPAAIDSLTEVVAAFQSADGDINNAITNLANAATTDLSAEISRAESAELSVDNRLTAVQDSLASDMWVHKLERIDDVNAEESRAESAEASITEELSSEVSNRIAGDQEIDSFIGFNDKGSATYDTYQMYLNVLSGNASLIQPDGYVWSSEEINQEFGPSNYTNYMSFARFYFYNMNQVSISAEVSRAESVEASIAEELSSEVSYIIANTDLSSIDSFAEVVADLSSEVSRAESVEVTKLDLAGGTMSGSIDFGASHGIDNALKMTANEITTNAITCKAGVDEEVYLMSPINAYNKKITNLPTPTNDGDATNKTYVDGEVSTEVARAESAELSLATDFTNIYAKKVAVTETPDGLTNTFTLANSVREGSELVYLNGLSLDSGDYTANISGGLVTSVTFATAPSTGDKVKAYGVY